MACLFTTTELYRNNDSPLLCGFNVAIKGLNTAAVVTVCTVVGVNRMPKLTRKNDLICWVYLSEIQQRIYQDFIDTPEVKEV